MLKKRILSLILTVAMLVLLFPCGVSAATATVDGTKYTVVSTEKELYDALVAGGKILLNNDIELDTLFAKPVSVKAGILLDGNGYALIVPNSRKSQLFVYKAGTSATDATSYIRNISFGTKDSPILLAGEATLFAEATPDTCAIVYQNVDFFVKGDKMAGMKASALYSTLQSVASFYQCNLYADLFSPTASLMGGWFAEVVGGDLIMTDCATYGSISGKASMIGAVFAQAGSGNSRFTNCTNFADVTGTAHVGGFVGNVGNAATSMYFTGCVNYGKITSEGTGYSSMAGGLLGRCTNNKDQGNQRLRVFYDCVNYGTITSGGRSGGLVGSSHDYDTEGVSANCVYYTFGNCINYGEINGSAYAGGMIGAASPVTYRAEVTDCINLGKITSTDGYAGNVAGMLSSGVIKGGFAAGVISTKQGSDPLVPCNAGKYTLQAGAFSGAAWNIVPAVASDVQYIGDATKLATGVTKVTEEALPAALAKLSELCGASFVAADESNTDAYVVTAEPTLRGVQQSVAVTNGKADLRLVVAVNAMDAYKTAGVAVKMTVNGETVEKVYETRKLYTELCDGSESGIAATDFANQYFYTITLSGVPTEGKVVIEATPYAIGADDTAYAGKTRVISYRDGSFGIEPLMLNGMLLSEYAIVFSSSNKMSEHTLALRLSDEIAKLTGVVLPVVFDKGNPTERVGKLLIGDTKLTTVETSGRTICTQENPNIIVITGNDTAELSESITYFIDSIAERMLQRESSWTFEQVEVPVDTTISMMAYNTGAKDNAAIKKAEWELILDYLPDILTMQEPYASFLDDFLNDYAVQPSKKFASSSRDVMDVVYNGTGKGYYGVYWGEARWKAGDPCTNGAASYSIILYAKDRFTVDESRSGTFWLSPTPDVSGSIFSGSDFPRCATYATLTDRNTGKTFAVVNVHLDFVVKTQLSQIETLLTELKARLGSDMPIVIMGDMNSQANSQPIAYYKNNAVMSMSAMDELADRAYRKHRNIDWFFINQPEAVDVTYYNYCGEHTFLNNLWNESLVMGMPSDHPAVYTEFKFR